MTAEQKRQIDKYRSQGIGYKRIAARIGMPENTVKSYFRRNACNETPEYTCHNCGIPVRQNPGRKEKKFCSDACRNAWWNSHLDMVRRKAIYQFTCPVCGEQFTAYGKHDRKYCSHACYIRGRFGGAECV